ncbi:MAG: hypothetical protein LBB39_03205 [Mycoplasmataceae bacterium]|jgi:hypothetical protein|nr:hypothetical protein [Mycoplasmataceae bacterium]
MSEANEKRIGEIKSIDFSDIPNPNDYKNVKVKEKGYKEIIIVLLISLLACGFGVGAYFLINYFLQK